jgi:DNA-binding CsgD family transcriptional regulator
LIRRVEIAVELSDAVRDTALAGIRRRHPDYTDEEAWRELRVMCTVRRETRGRASAPPSASNRGRLLSPMVRQVALYGAVGGVLIALLKIIEYKHFVREYPSEIYGGLVALIFTAIGIYFGLRWTRAREVVVIREVPVRMEGPFVLNAEKLKEVGLTAREHEILALIAQGLSNREIGEKLFVSENTVKTHSSRLFEKMQVNRRVQAVQKGKDLGLIP